MQAANLPRYYTDLRAYEKGMKDADTPWTPAVGLVIALRKSLDLILQEGLDNVFKRCADNAAFTRQKLKEIGLELFSKAPASTVSGAIVPEGIDGEKLVKIMRDEKGITMAGGQGDMKGKVIRICHMGAITRKDLEEGLRVLKETLESMSVQSKK
jgi:aspartate aminotransferase-like enzyme